MPDVKFSCPHCQQHIQADTGYGGMQINCPACNGALIVPGQPAPSLPSAPVQTSPTATATAPVSVQRSTSGSATSTCPSCGMGLGRGAVLCTNCGYNIATGQRTVAGRSAALGKPGSPGYATPWYKTPYPYVGALLVVLGTLYLLGRSNPVMLLAFVGVAALYSLSIHILVLVAAFRTDVGTGFLALCIPFYALYFVFKVHDNDTLKVLYSVAILLNIAFRFIKPD